MQDVGFKQNWGCIWGDEKLIEKWGEQYESERAMPSGMQNALVSGFQAILSHP